MEQPTIFEDNFGSEPTPHRRHLLPLWAKIYCWITMTAGILQSIGILWYINYIMKNFSLTLEMNPNEKIHFFIEYYYIVTLGLVIFTVPLLLWLGKKWAITFNWILSALFVLPAIFVQLHTPSETSGTLSIFILLPIWLVQIPIQKKWNRTAPIII
jgi:hypothetical protein